MINLVCPKCGHELFKTDKTDCIEVLKTILEVIMRRRKTLVAYDLSYNIDLIFDPLTCMNCGEVTASWISLIEKEGKCFFVKNNMDSNMVQQL